MKIKEPEVESKENISPKKELPKHTVSSFLLLGVMALCFGVTLPLHFCYPRFTWNWVVFVIALIIPPFALYNAKRYLESISSFTQEQMKSTNIQFFKMSLGTVFWDCVYLAFFNHWNIPSFILGTLGVVKFFYALAINFPGRKKRETLFDVFMIGDFLAGTALAIYLICLIPNPTIQTVVTTIVAAMMGGLLTLAGVAWTIRQQDAIRQEEEKKKAKPVFILNKYRYKPKAHEIEKECLIEDDTDITCENEIIYCKNFAAEIENSNNNAFELMQVFHDKKWFSPSGKAVILPSGKITVSFSFNDPNDSIILDICDSIGNHHYYLLQAILAASIFESNSFYSVGDYSEIFSNDLRKRNISF